MHPSAPEWDFAIFQKNGVNMKPVGVNRCYTVSQWTRIPSILPMGTSPCKGERLASTYRHHHFTLYFRFGPHKHVRFELTFVKSRESSVRLRMGLVWRSPLTKFRIAYVVKTPRKLA